MSQGPLEEVAVTVAQKNAMERGCAFLPHGCRLFTVAQGWESRAIQGDPGVATCGTLLLLEAALRNSSVKVVFIPEGALMTDGDIEKICRRNGVAKTLFKEVKA